MVENLAENYQNKVNEITLNKSLCIKQIDEILFNNIFWGHQNKSFEFRLHELIVTSTYILKNQFKYLQDRWGAEMNFVHDNNYLVLVISGLDAANTKSFWTDFKHDIKQAFDEIMRTYKSFYSSFEEPYLKESVRTKRDFVESFFIDGQSDYYPFLYFKDQIKELSNNGIRFDLSKIQNQAINYYAIHTGNKIKFIPDEEWIIEGLKRNIDEYLDALDFPDAQVWLRRVINHMSLSHYKLFSESWLHLKDFLNSEDALSVEKNFNKIGLSDMIRRSNQVFNKRFVKLKEKPGDTVEVFKANNLKVVQLMTTHALDRETSFLNHCIGRGAYDKRLDHAYTQFYSIRTRRNNEPLVTMEVVDYQVLQIRGYKNSIPNESTDLIIKDFMTQFNLRLAPIEDFLTLRCRIIV